MTTMISATAANPPTTPTTMDLKKSSNNTSRLSKQVLLAAFIFLASALSLRSQSFSTQLYASTVAADLSSQSMTNATSYSALTANDNYYDTKHSYRPPSHPYGALDEADCIIRKAYEKSYAHILSCGDDQPGISPRGCIEKTQKYIHNLFKIYDTDNIDNTESQNNNSTRNSPASSIPWWFHTLLRDLPTSGAYGPWHHFTTIDPAFHFCTIAKVGTTEWRKVFNRLNIRECVGEHANTTPCLKGRAWNTREVLPKDAPRAVFLRDPLERLLSAYLDKCEKPNVRKSQKHCEPNTVWNPSQEELMKSRVGEKFALTEYLEGKDKAMFAAYVDTFPLKWNLHFIPQAMVCDLHSSIHTYDFVGNMGKEFMNDLDRMATTFGGRLPRILNESFNYQTLLKEEKENLGKDNNRHSTHAPAKVAKYYTAGTVRKALEYVSVDYVTLGLSVPDWARDMLRNDAM